MLDLEKLNQEIIKKYPQALKVKNKDYNIKVPIINDVYLDIYFKNYPKLPKVKLKRGDGKFFKLDKIIPTLRDWHKTTPPSIIELIDEIFLLIESIASDQIFIKKALLEGLMKMCKESHPKKITGLLSVEKGIVSEYILPSYACTNPKKDRYVWGLPSCAIPLDLSYQGTFISRPEGSLAKNEKLNQIFKKRRFTLLIGYPYDDFNCIKCFDSEGKVINFSLKE